jgi:GntR family histidine utilization transcriptional repressor
MADRGAGSLHTRIRDDIRARILEGSWAPGDRLARETELAAAYGVSRMTMNKALNQLAQEGYLVRRKRGGTFVARERTQSAVLAIGTIAEEVAALGRAYRWQLLDRDRRYLVPADLHRLGVRRRVVEEETVVLSGLHLADEAPFCLETRAINLDAVPGAAQAEFATEVPGQWLLRTMPWTTARHQVRAVNVTGGEARALGLGDGAAGLEILRKTQHGGDWVTYVRMLYPGEAHQLVAEFGPEATGAR